MKERRRIRPPAEYEKLIDELTEKRVFESKQAVMMFAAALGCRGEKSRDIGKAGEGVRYSIFEGRGDDVFINALAVALKGSVEALDPDGPEDDDAIALFEKAVAGGLDTLDAALKSGPGDPLQICLGLLQPALEEAETPGPDLGGLDAEALRIVGGIE
jgi:dnd system-associated protein 4